MGNKFLFSLIFLESKDHKGQMKAKQNTVGSLRWLCFCSLCEFNIVDIQDRICVSTED